MKFEGAFLVVFNALARVLGVIATTRRGGFPGLRGPIEGSSIDIAIMGTFVCATGVAFLMTKRVGPEQLDRFRSSY